MKFNPLKCTFEVSSGMFLRHLGREKLWSVQTNFQHLRTCFLCFQHETDSSLGQMPHNSKYIYRYIEVYLLPLFLCCVKVQEVLGAQMNMNKSSSWWVLYGFSVHIYSTWPNDEYEQKLCFSQRKEAGSSFIQISSEKVSWCKWYQVKLPTF